MTTVAATAAHEGPGGNRVEIEVLPAGRSRRRGRGRLARGVAVLAGLPVVVALAVPMALVGGHAPARLTVGLPGSAAVAPRRAAVDDVSARLVSLLPGGVAHGDVVPAGPLSGPPTVDAVGHATGHDVGSGSVTYGSGAPMVLSVVVRRVTTSRGCAAPACRERGDGTQITATPPHHPAATAGLVADLPGGYEVHVTQVRTAGSGAHRSGEARALTVRELETLATSTTWRD